MLKSTTHTLAGSRVTVRPISEADETMETAFVDALSMQSKRFRFFCAVRALPASEVKALCKIDGLHSMAFVATVQDHDREVEIGVCRYVADAQTDVREMTVTLADEWHHKGLGELLLKNLMAQAKQYGIHKLYATELHGNQTMREIADKLGMSAITDPEDSRQIIYSLYL